ncbi:lysis protein [Rahnella sp. ChDrAdgB13]|uniref:lysis protein n=1 Tax=Rahnella sp. ChDrAdgB13 TaxID=1850581 RepID=UPI001AD85492|nr:lysis protein [Rahnella sp. ChDrAdgB13]
MNIRLLAAAGAVAAVLILGWTADHYYHQAVTWRKSARDARAVVQTQAATIADMNQRQQKLAALDKTHTEALNAAETENDNLRRQLADGSRRMYVHARCPVSGLSTKTNPGGVGNATTVELSADAEQNVLDIRAGIISDQQKLRYLQEYIRTECLN